MRPGTIVPALDNPCAPEIFRLIEKNALLQLMDLLEKETVTCAVALIKDVRCYTLLAFCAMKNNLLAMKIVYEHAMQYNEFAGSEAEVRNWAN